MKKGLIVALALMVSACANKPNLSTPHVVGAGVGALAGGAIGYQFGGGVTQSLATTVGAILGGAVGYTMGPRLWPSDRIALNQATHRALFEPDGEIVTWSNPETGNGGMVRPTRSFLGPTGTMCRQFRTSLAWGNGTTGGTGLACLQADGSWSVVEDRLG